MRMNPRPRRPPSDAADWSSKNNPLTPQANCLRLRPMNLRWMLATSALLFVLLMVSGGAVRAGSTPFQSDQIKLLDGTLSNASAAPSRSGTSRALFGRAIPARPGAIAHALNAAIPIPEVVGLPVLDPSMNLNFDPTT